MPKQKELIIDYQSAVRTIDDNLALQFIQQELGGELASDGWLRLDEQTRFEAARAFARQNPDGFDQFRYRDQKPVAVGNGEFRAHSRFDKTFLEMTMASSILASTVRITNINPGEEISWGDTLAALNWRRTQSHMSLAAIELSFNEPAAVAREDAEELVAA